MIVTGAVKTKYVDNKFHGRIDFLADEKVNVSDIPEEVEYDGTTYVVDPGSTITTINGDMMIKGESKWGEWL